MTVYALVPAAGTGSRLGATTPKQYLDVAGRAMLSHSIALFLDCSLIARTFVLVSPGDVEAEKLLGSFKQESLAVEDKVTLLFCGGSSRAQTVASALDVLATQYALDREDWVLVHDAARPGLGRQVLENLIASLADDPVGGLLALPISDSVKRAEGKDKLAPQVLASVPREDLWLAQTPQMFRFGVLRSAMIAAQKGELEGITDEASAVSALGLQPRLVKGESCNFKVTTSADLLLMDAWIRARFLNPDAGT